MTHGPVDLSIVIVAYNSTPWLPDCLESLRKAEAPARRELFVVDNASTDGSADLVRERFPEARLLRNARNLGYARAVNRAWREAAGRHLLVLNPDVVVRPDALARLHGHLERNPRTGLVAPRLWNTDGSVQASSRTHYTMATYALRRTPLARIFPDHPIVRRHLMADWDRDEVRAVDWVLGAAMMMRREAIGATVMDERYFIYFEDVDLCVRLQQEGWQVVYDPSAEMVHHHRRASAGGFLNRRKYEHFKSWIKFNLKHAGTARGGERESVRP
ncbi:MAG: glycosyltransferase family 2 protein [Acidobacteriota bacterium]